MFIGYKIVNNVLCIYIDDKYEIGSFNKENTYNIKSKINNYIRKHKIKFNGTKVILLISGLMIGSVILDNNYNQKVDYDVYNGSNYVYHFEKENKIMNNNILINNVDESSNTKDDVSTKTNDNYTNSNVNELLNTKNDIRIKKSDSYVNDNVNESSQNNNIENVYNIDANNQNFVQEKVKNNNDLMINVHRKNGSILNISLNEYLIGVVASEMPASFNDEALKAQAIVSRTYALKLIEKSKIITDDNSTQIYMDNNELKNIWKNNYEYYYNKIKNAVYDTNDLKIKYDGKLIDAVYFSTSNGYTEDSINVWNNDYPYLKSVLSTWDTSSSTFLREVDISFSDISTMLNTDFNSNQDIEILSRNNSNRVDKIRVNDKVYTGVELRFLLNLRSTDFDFEICDDYVKFKTRGYGHGVGFSQYGANGMAKEGYKYDEIIKHYYTGVYIE